MELTHRQFLDCAGFHSVPSTFKMIWYLLIDFCVFVVTRLKMCIGTWQSPESASHHLHKKGGFVLYNILFKKWIEKMQYVSLSSVKYQCQKFSWYKVHWDCYSVMEESKVKMHKTFHRKYQLTQALPWSINESNMKLFLRLEMVFNFTFLHMLAFLGVCGSKRGITKIPQVFFGYCCSKGCQEILETIQRHFFLPFPTISIFECFR